MADSRSAEVPVAGSEVQNRRKDQPSAGRVLIGGAKLGGKALWGTTKFASKGVAGALLSIAAVASGAGAGNPEGFQDKTQDILKNPPGRVVRNVAKESKDVLTAAVDATISKTDLRDKKHDGMLVEPLSGGEIKDKDLGEIVDFYYPGASEEKRNKIATNIQVMHEYYKGTSEQPPLLPAETYEVLSSKIDLIREVSGGSKELENAIVGLAIAESRGGVDGGIMTEAGATGPFMMTEDFIREHGYEPTNDENDPRLKWEITVPIVASELAERAEYFGGNMGFAVWSWHRGVAAVEGDIKQFAQIRGFFSELPTEQLVREHGITEYDLEEEDVIRRDLLHPGQNSTTIFVLRNAAGALVWIHVQQLADRVGPKEQQPQATVREFPRKPSVEAKTA